MLFKFVRTVFWSGLFTLALCGGAVAGMYYHALGELPDVDELKHVSFETPMQVYSRDGKLIGEFGEHKRIPVKLEDIPLKLRQAFLAIEDTRFYEHSGIDPIGILRASLVALTNAQATQGASTITQQVARNFFLTRERTIQRKLKEIFISWRIEQVLTKDEILELYLNKIALGHRSYGVAAAAQTYYGKELADLTLAEMATIAGLPKAPSTLNPISHPERAQARRHLVLGRMLDLGFITKEEYETADAAPAKTYYHSTPLDLNAPYVAEEARKFALEQYGENAYVDGIKVYTTIDSKLQDYANYAVFKGVTDYDTRHGYRGAAANIYALPNFSVSVDNIKDLLLDYDDYQYIHPALVQALNDETRTITVFKQDGREYDLPWESIAWARAFKGDRNQGPAPQKPSDIVKPGDIIYTYIDEEGKEILTQWPEVGAALISLYPYDGGIAAMVGGYDFALSKLNRALQAKRQTGSNFKPFLYSAAVAKGIAVNSPFWDMPLKTWDPGSQTWWQPTNSPNRFDGIMTLREGLAKSKNVVTIRLMRQVGVPAFVEHLKKFGIEVPAHQQSEAMALGSVELTPLQTVTGYCIFLNGGYRLTPYLIDRIYKDDELLYQATPQIADPKAPDLVENAIALTYKEGMQPAPNAAPQVLSHGHAFIMSDMLSTVIYGGQGIQGRYWGTGSRAAAYTGRTDLHGKTGTTNDVHDAWFTGFNANLIATAWVGFDNERDLGYSRTKGSEGGAYTALPIFTEYFKRAQPTDSVPPAPIDKPADVYRAANSYGLYDYVLPGSTALQEPGEMTDSMPDPAGAGAGSAGGSTIDEDSIF